MRQWESYVLSLCKLEFALRRLIVRAQSERRAHGGWGNDGSLSARWRLILRLGGRGRGVRALARAAACLCAGAGLLHLPAFGQRSLVNRLKSESLPLTLIKGLGKKKWMTISVSAKITVIIYKAYCIIYNNNLLLFYYFFKLKQEMYQTVKKK